MFRIILISSLCFSALGADWYVSPTVLPSSLGGSGNGTITNPGALYSAVRHANWATNITGGDTVWLRGGTYTNPFNTFGNYYYLIGETVTNDGSSYWSPQFSGSSNNYVTWRSYTNEWAAVDGFWRLAAWIGMQTNGNPLLTDYHRFRDLEFYNSKKGSAGDSTGDLFDGNANDGSGGHNEWINCLLHDCGGVWGAAPALHGSIRGCITWYVGQTGSTHVLYGAADRISGNIWGWVSGFWIQGGGVNSLVYSNIFYNSAGYQVDAASTAGMKTSYGSVFVGNVFYQKDWTSSSAINSGGAVFLTNNIIASGANDFACTNLVLWNNTFYMNVSSANYATWGQFVTNGHFSADYNSYYAKSPCIVAIDSHYGPSGGWFTWNSWTNTFPQYDSHSTAHDATTPPDEVRVIPNQDQPKRANIAVCNWSLQNNVSVPLSNVLSSGDTYSLYNAQNYLAGPIQIGTYNGTNIHVPMTNLTTATLLFTNMNGRTNVGSIYMTNTFWSTRTAQPAPTTPEFGAFVVIGEAAAKPLVLPVNQPLAPPRNLRVAGTQ
jgi:hypothetical protein